MMLTPNNHTEDTDTMTTISDGLTERLFGPDKPTEERGPIVDRRELQNKPMITRFIRKGKAGDQVIFVFQLANTAGTLFALWHTQQLGGKLANTKRGEVILLEYLGQSEDADKIHQWSIKPFAGTPTELANLVRQEPWRAKIAAFVDQVGLWATLERERRASRGDGAPPHDDRDSPFPPLRET